CGDDVVDAREGCDEGIGACFSGSPQNGHECSTAAGHQMCLQAGGSCVDADGADRGASCDTFPSNCLSDTVRDACRASQCRVTQPGVRQGGCRAACCGDGVLGGDAPAGPSIPSPCEQCELRPSNDGAAGNCPNCAFAFCPDGLVKNPRSCGNDPNLPC